MANEGTPAAGKTGAEGAATPVAAKEEPADYILRRNAAGIAVFERPRGEDGKFKAADAAGEGAVGAAGESAGKGELPAAGTAGAVDAAPQAGGEKAKAEGSQARRAEIGGAVLALEQEAYAMEVEIAHALGTQPPPAPHERSLGAYPTDHQKAITQLTMDRYAAQRRVDALKAQRDTLLKRQEQAADTAGSDGAAAPAKRGLPVDDDPALPKPKYEDFDSAEDFQIASADWVLAKRTKEAAAGARQAQAAEQDRKFTEQLTALVVPKLNAAIALEPDFKPAIEGLTIPRTAAYIIGNSDVGEHLALELVRDPELLARLSRSDAPTIARELGKIEGRLAADPGKLKKAAAPQAGEPAKLRSNAPAPIKPETGRSSPDTPLESLSVSQIAARLRKSGKL